MGSDNDEGSDEEGEGRIGEIAAKGRQRYLEAGGDQKICPSGRKGNRN